MSGYGPYELTGGLLGDLLSDLDQGMSELLNNLCIKHHQVQPQIHDTHGCLNWFRSDEPDGQSVVSVPRNSCSSNHHFEDLVLVPNSSQGTAGYDKGLCPQWHASPDRYWSTTKHSCWLMSQATLMFILVSPDFFKSVTYAQCKW